MITCVASCEIEEILSLPIEENAYIGITHKASSGWQILKSRFQGFSPKGIKITPPITTYGNKQDLNGEIGVSFRKGHQKVIFQTQCSANIFEWPTKILQIGRGIYKKQVPPQPIAVRFWDSTRDVYYGELTNISGGGLGVQTTCPYPKGQYTCAIDANPHVMGESLLKHCEQDGNYYILNFQFLGIDLDPANKLKRIQSIHREFNRSRYRSSEAVLQETAAKSAEELHYLEWR